MVRPDFREEFLENCDDPMWWRHLSPEEQKRAKKWSRKKSCFPAEPPRDKAERKRWRVAGAAYYSLPPLVIVFCVAVLLAIFVSIIESGFDPLTPRMGPGLWVGTAFIGLSILATKWWNRQKLKREGKAGGIENLAHTGAGAAQRQGEMSGRGRTIVKATLVTSSSRKKVGSIVGRAAIGSLFGVGGMAVGAATAKNRESATFYVEFQDGHTATETVEVNSSRFHELMRYT